MIYLKSMKDARERLINEFEKDKKLKFVCHTENMTTFELKIKGVCTHKITVIMKEPEFFAKMTIDDLLHYDFEYLEHNIYYEKFLGLEKESVFLFSIAHSEQYQNEIIQKKWN